MRSQTFGWIGAALIAGLTILALVWGKADLEFGIPMTVLAAFLAAVMLVAGRAGKGAHALVGLLITVMLLAGYWSAIFMSHTPPWLLPGGALALLAVACLVSAILVWTRRS